MKSSLGKYKIGLAVIGVFTLGLVGLLFMQASATKQDTETDKKVASIGAKLDSFVASKQTIPASLAAAGINDVPSSIIYSKVSSTEYKVCINYKAKSSNFDATQAISDVVTANYGAYSSFDTSGDSSAPQYLSVPTSHHKGQNCQTIKPYTTGFSDTPFDFSNNYPSSSLSTSAEDVERQVDLKTLQSQLEAAYANSGRYPTLAQLNDANWRATNMPGLDKESLRDPKGKDYTVVAASAKNTYSYGVTADGGKVCDNVTVDCVMYTLTANLDNGSTDVLDSLN